MSTQSERKCQKEETRERKSERGNQRESFKVRGSVGCNVSYSVGLQCEAITYVSVK
jgi:hypothetical protein